MKTEPAIPHNISKQASKLILDCEASDINVIVIIEDPDGDSRIVDHCTTKFSSSIIGTLIIYLMEKRQLELNELLKKTDCSIG